ncbi:ABC transporter substrate-binding protein [Treponema sp. R8-4-B8]
MKRKLFFIITFAAVLSAVSAKDKIIVTTTTFPAYDFVRQIAKDRVNLNMLLPPGAESHSFEPSPRDIITVQKSDIFIHVGGGGDAWVDRILKSMNTKNKKVYAMMESVDVVEEETVEGMEEEQEPVKRGGYIARFFNFITGRSKKSQVKEIEYDEHVWTSPRNAILIVKRITDLLCETDPDNAAFYRQNSSDYIKSLEDLDAEFTKIVAGAKRKTIVFGDRFPFRYFANAYGLTYYAAFPGCSTETEASAGTVAFLINKIRSEQIPVVFHIELSNEKMADAISKETGAKKLLLHACHNVSKKDFDAGLGYLDFMRGNAENLRQALY